ncbi:MAG TPA: serine/threonine-protein kinase [Phycisphaerae bacterium]
MGKDPPLLDESQRRARLRDFITAAQRQASRAGQLSGSVSRTDGAGDGRRTALPVDCFAGYELTGELHRGGQGVVYRAVQRSTRRQVAIKVMREGPFAAVADVARFDREIEILARLEHPNIVGILDRGATAGHYYFVMDYVDGQPLDCFAKREKSRSQKTEIRATLALFAKVCDAISAAHLLGIVHRDLKPGNILIDAQGAPHILDFGLAKVANDPVSLRHPTQSGQFIGSLPWASPEQVGGGAIDMRTDVYALGVLLYQALTGTFPYAVVGQVRDIFNNILTAPPIRPRRQGSGVRSQGSRIDDEIETIVLKCLAKDPARRYASAGDLARDLRRYLAEEPIEAKRDSTLYILRKTLWRFRLPVAVAGVFIALLAASTVVAWTLSLRARQAAAAAARSESNAKQSEQLANLRLRDSLIAQAHATRLTGQVGQRFEALEALRRSARIGPTPEARSEAIAAMALPDLHLVRRLKRSGLGYFDSEMERCAVMHPEGATTVVRIADDQEIADIPAPVTGWTNIHWGSLVGRFYVRVFDPPEGDPGHVKAVSRAGRRLEVWSLPQALDTPQPNGHSPPVRDRGSVPDSQPAYQGQAELHLEFSDVPKRARHDISPDGKRLAVGRLDQAIHIYDLESGQEVQRIPLDRTPSYVTFDPSGRRLALYHASFENAQILDLETGRSEPAFEAHNIAWAVAWHPDGNLLAGANRTRVELWDCQARSSRGVLSGHQAQIVHVQFSHDGTLLLTYSWDGAAFLWDAGTLRPLLRVNLTNPVFSPDDRVIAGTAFSPSLSHPEIHELDGALERRRLIGRGDPDRFGNAYGAFEPASGLLVTAERSDSGESAALRMFDVEAGRELAMCAIRDVQSLAVDPPGRFILTGHNEGVNRWPLAVEGGRMIVGPPQPVFADGPVSGIELSANGQSALLAGYSQQEFALLDLGAGGEARRFACPVSGGVRISPDGRWATINTGWASGTEVWDLHREARVLQLPLSHTAFSPDGQCLASSDANGIFLREVGSWRVLRQAPPGPGLVGLRFSPDARILAAMSGPTTIELIDSQTLERLATLEPPESYYTTDFAFSPDGALLAQFTNRAGVEHLWDLRRIRARLAVLSLDWNQPPYPPAVEAPTVEWQVEIDAGSP